MKNFFHTLGDKKITVSEKGLCFSPPEEFRHRFYIFTKISLLVSLILGLIFLPCCGIYKYSSKGKYPPIKPENYKPLLEDNLDSKIEDLSSQIANSITMWRNGKVAVIDFVDLSGRSVNNLCRYIPNGLTDKLFRTEKFQLVERKLLPQIMEELKLNFTDLVDPRSAKKMGRLLGADALLSGTITDMVDSIKVSARLIETETGKILAVAEADITKSDKVKKLTGTGIVVLSRPHPSAHSEAEKQEDEKTLLPKGNLVVNGDFEEPWTIGWERMVANPSRGAYHVKIVYSADGEGDDDLYLRHTGESFMTLSQRIPVVSSHLLFSASFKLGPAERSGATSMIELQYGDKKGRRLGATRIINYQYNPFIYTKQRELLDTGFVHHIKLESRWYKDYTINLREEIINHLPAIDPDRIKEIGIVVYVGGDYEQCVSELYADNLKLWYK